MSSETFNVPPLERGMYEHYKGKRYNVVGVGCHTETNEYFVVYMPLYDHKGQPDIWVRPYSMFVEEVMIGERKVPRFKKVDE